MSLRAKAGTTATTKLAGLQPMPRADSKGHQEDHARGPTGTQRPGGNREPQTRRRERAERRGSKAKNPAPLGHCDPWERRHYQTTSPRPRFLGSWTKNSAHLRPLSRAGTSPSLCASVAILVTKRLSPPPPPTPPPRPWIGYGVSLSST